MKHTVLLVEDEEDLRELMRDALEAHGYEVVAARDGREALAVIPRIGHLCVVLLDLLMPTMNGWDFYAAMRARPELAKIPVVIHTSAPEKAPQGVTRVLAKPTRIDQLFAIVAELCGE